MSAVSPAVIDLAGGPASALAAACRWPQQACAGVCRLRRIAAVRHSVICRARDSIPSSRNSSQLARLNPQALNSSGSSRAFGFALIARNISRRSSAFSVIVGAGSSISFSALLGMRRVIGLSTHFSTLTFGGGALSECFAAFLPTAMATAAAIAKMTAAILSLDFIGALYPIAFDSSAPGRAAGKHAPPAAL